MRAFYYTILLFSTIALFSACKSNESATYRAFYSSVNKEYAAATSIGEARRSEEAAERARQSEKKKKQAESSELESVQLTLESNGNESNGNGTGNKASSAKVPSTSAAASASVAPVAKVTPTTQSTTASQATTVQAPAKSEPKASAPVVNKKAGNGDDLKNVFRKGKIVAEEGYEDQLKKYSVVIAALSKKNGVERLKAAFEASDEPFVIAKNNKGIYYFILGSSDEREDAVAKRAEVREKYVNRFSKAELMKQYAIPFSDVWIAVNE